MHLDAIHDSKSCLLKPPTVNAAGVNRRAEAFAGVQQLAAAVRRMGSRKPGNPVSFDVQPDQKWWSTDTSAIVTGGQIALAFSSL